MAALPLVVALFLSFGFAAFFIGYFAGFVDGWTSRKVGSALVRAYRWVRRKTSHARP